MNRFNSPDEFRTFVLWVLLRDKNEAASDYTRAVHDWQVSEAEERRALERLEKTCEAIRVLNDTIAVNLGRVQVDSAVDIEGNVLVQVRLHAVGSTTVTTRDRVDPEADIGLAVKHLKEGLMTYLFEPPKPEEQTPPVQP